MVDIMNNKMKIKIYASGKPLEAHVMAITNLSNEGVVISINKVIEENGITYEDIKPPRSENSHILTHETKQLIEEKLLDIGLEIYIYGFLTYTKKLCNEEYNKPDGLKHLSERDEKHLRESQEHNEELMKKLSKL